MYHSHQSEKLKGPILRVMGTLILRMSESPRNKRMLAYEAIAPIISSASAARNTLPLRVAAMKCLKHCNILAATTTSKTSAWHTVILLLQDENTDIRSYASEMACNAIGSSYLVEKLTLRNSFEKTVTTSTDPDVNYFDCKIREMLDTYVSNGSRDFNLNVESVFEIEEDNIYKEPLLEKQLHARLDHITNSTVNKSQESLQFCLPLILSLNQRTDWLGGPTFHTKIYTELYACILGCTRQGVTIRPGLQEECKTFLEQMTHVHPSIRKSLQIFSESGSAGISAHDINEICFLA